MSSKRDFRKLHKEAKVHKLKPIPQIDPTEEAVSQPKEGKSPSKPEEQQVAAQPKTERIESGGVLSNDDELVKLTTRVKWRNFKGIKTLAVDMRQNDYEIVDAALEDYLRRLKRL